MYINFAPLESTPDFATGWRLKPRCIVNRIQFVHNIATRKQYSSPSFSTTTYWKKTEVTISAGQVRCALYKAIQRLNKRDIHFVGPKLLSTDWNISGMTCQQGRLNHRSNWCNGLRPPNKRRPPQCTLSTASSPRKKI